MALVARDPAALEATAADVRRGGGEAIAITADVTNPDQSTSAVRQAAAALGAFDAIIHAAGRGFRGAFAEIDEATWREAFDLDFFAAVRIVRLAVPHMRKGGRIVLIGAASAKQPHCVSLRRTPRKPRSPISPPAWPRSSRPIWLSIASHQDGFLRSGGAIAPPGRDAPPDNRLMIGCAMKPRMSRWDASAILARSRAWSSSSPHPGPRIPPASRSLWTADWCGPCDGLPRHARHH